MGTTGRVEWLTWGDTGKVTVGLEELIHKLRLLEFSIEGAGESLASYSELNLRDEFLPLVELVLECQTKVEALQEAAGKLHGLALEHGQEPVGLEGLAEADKPAGAVPATDGGRGRRGR